MSRWYFNIRHAIRVIHYWHDPRDPVSLSKDRVWVIYEGPRSTF
jgi:hypothetical protein